MLTCYYSNTPVAFMGLPCNAKIRWLPDADFGFINKPMHFAYIGARFGLKNNFLRGIRDEGIKEEAIADLWMNNTNP